MSRLGRMWPPMAASLVVATLVFARQIASMGNLHNRYIYAWQRRDGLTLILAVVMLAAAFFVVGFALSRWEWSRRRRLHEIALLVTLVAAILAQIHPLSKSSTPLLATLLWVVVGGLLWYGWRRWPDQLARFTRGACLVQSPLVPILFVQVLRWHSWDTREASVLPAPPSLAGRPPAVIIVFDEWSWYRVAPDGAIATRFSNLHWLAERSILVREARSAGGETQFSLPRFLFQREGAPVPDDGFAWWKERDTTRISSEIPDLFDGVRQLGYRSVLLGWYIPYRGLLGPDGADRIVGLPYAYKGRTWSRELFLMYFRNLQYFTDPLSIAAWSKLTKVVNSDNWFHLHRMLHDSFLEALAAEPDNTLIMAHLPVPHAPFIFEEDGRFRGPYRGKKTSNDPTGYERQLRYTDVVLGEVIHALQQSGRFDQTLLVVTSDHTWRAEPDSALVAHPDALLRVPLLIKWPGQERPMVSDEPFCLRAFEPILTAALTPPAPPILTDSLWQVISEPARTTRCAP